MLKHKNPDFKFVILLHKMTLAITEACIKMGFHKKVFHKIRNVYVIPSLNFINSQVESKKIYWYSRNHISSRIEVRLLEAYFCLAGRGRSNKEPSVIKSYALQYFFFFKSVIYKTHYNLFMMWKVCRKWISIRFKEDMKHKT